MRAHFDLAGPAHPLEHPLADWLYRRASASFGAAGIALDGPNPGDPQIHRPRALLRLLTQGTLGAGESYVDGDWDCAALDELTCRLLTAHADRRWGHWSATGLAGPLAAHLANLQSRSHSRQDIASHYDLDNDLYAAMLGSTMAYSCGYWARASTLDEAQEAKHALICEKLGLQPGMRVLDIGCGWGGFAEFAARRLGVTVVGITLSAAQEELARQRCAGLPVTILMQDYRDVAGTFDRIVSIGMFEHVGPRNYSTFFATARARLVPDGLMLLHTIGGNRSEITPDPWIGRYVFPHSVLPSVAQIGHAIEGLFVLEDWHSFGADYDRTLMAWSANLDASWPRHARRHDERFHRLWRYYLLTCAGVFRARRNQLWQLVLSPRGVAGGYRRIAG
ncbi:MAG: cyclopropane fatty acyl phospholipid synthase [Vicinamibacterales bacterium]